MDVVEVGMRGRSDATNIISVQVVSSRLRKPKREKERPFGFPELVSSSKAVDDVGVVVVLVPSITVDTTDHPSLPSKLPPPQHVKISLSCFFKPLLSMAHASSTILAYSDQSPLE